MGKRKWAVVWSWKINVRSGKSRKEPWPCHSWCEYFYLGYNFFLGKKCCIMCGVGWVWGIVLNYLSDSWFAFLVCVNTCMTTLICSMQSDVWVLGVFLFDELLREIYPFEWMSVQLACVCADKTLDRNGRGHSKRGVDFLLVVKVVLGFSLLLDQLVLQCIWVMGNCLLSPFAVTDQSWLEIVARKFYIPCHWQILDRSFLYPTCPDSSSHVKIFEETICATVHRSENLGYTWKRFDLGRKLTQITVVFIWHPGLK